MSFHEWCSCLQLCKHVCKRKRGRGWEGDPHLKLFLVEVLPLLPLNLQGLNMVEEVGQDGLQGNFLSVLLLLHDLWPADARATKSPTRACPHHIAGRDFLKQLPITAGRMRLQKCQKNKQNENRNSVGVAAAVCAVVFPALPRWSGSSAGSHMQGNKRAAISGTEGGGRKSAALELASWGCFHQSIWEQNSKQQGVCSRKKTPAVVDFHFSLF